MDNTNNKEFWNHYVDYFENKINEANSDLHADDKTAGDKIYEMYFKKLNVGREEKFLDFGCGFARLYPIYKESIQSSENKGYFGIDISRRELELAEKKHGDLKMGKSLIEFDGERIPFPDHSFDKITCWGVFDACLQEKILRELLRVLNRGGGVLLLTGKNDRYYADDEAALTAEVNARKKEHPNYFTDVTSMMEQLAEHKIRLAETFYFLRRGDFTVNRTTQAKPDIFYEWAFFLDRKSVV